MKHYISIFCLLLTVLMILTSCSQTSGEKDVTGKYRLNKNGEAIINDVPFPKDASSGREASASDNARVFYEIFTGSFSDSNGDGTGDLRGIINRLDYLNDGDPDSGVSLGVEGLWLTPIFKSPSYHKYDVADFYTIDPIFGTLEDFKELAEKCHSRNIKVILDLPINHTSRQNSWYRQFENAHATGNTGSEYYDFYSWYREGSDHTQGTWSNIQGTPDYVECNFSGDMPELNFNNETVRKEVLAAAKYWLDQGADGFRFDAAKYLYLGNEPENVNFWKWYVSELKAVKPDLYTVAEVWDADAVTDAYYPAMNCFNFTLSQVSGLIAKAAKGGSVKNLTDYTEAYISRVKGLNPEAMIIPFISNHDMDRAAGYLPASGGQMQMGASLYLLSPGSPFIYYGEETGRKGSRGSENTDANRRLAMLWGDDDTVKDPEGSTYEQKNPGTVKEELGDGGSLLSFYKKLLMIRKANPEIAKGDYVSLDLKTSKAGGFKSTLDGKTVYVLHNTSEDPVEIDLSLLSEGSAPAISTFIGSGKAVVNDGKLTLDSLTSVVLR
ncbi:MAG: hypothetical protein IIY77_01585 [Lachnospiraceae bacterium]|nr:hypothetical protein [Lachnospiraceae bacterium]